MFHEGTSSTKTLGSLGKNCVVSMIALFVTSVDCPRVPLNSGEAGDGNSVFGVASHSWWLPSLLQKVEVAFGTGSGLSKTREGIISSFLNGEQEYGLMPQEAKPFLMLRDVIDLSQALVINSGNDHLLMVLIGCEERCAGFVKIRAQWTEYALVEGL